MRGLIVTGGIIDDVFACDKIKNGGFDMIVAADSGMNFLFRHHLTPNVVVGDFDSVDNEVLSYFKEKKTIEFTRLNTDKDDTDTEFAVRDAISRGLNDITIIGATGGRIDHLMGNINILGIGLEQNVEICLIDPLCRVRLINSGLTIRKDTQYGKYVSLIPYYGQADGVTLTGFKYNLSDYNMGGFNSLGISNEIVDEEAHIQLSGGYLLVVESLD